MKLTLISSLLFVSSAAFAQINFNNVTYSGSGCAKGTVSTAVSPDGSALSVLFDEFRAEVPDYQSAPPRGRMGGGPTHSLKSCALSFTASIPAGMKVDTLEISLQARGATILDQGVSAAFVSMLVGYNGLARSRAANTLVAAKKWRGLGETNDSWTETPTAQIALQSGCSGANVKDIRFDLKNHVIAEILDGNLQKHGMITLDSNDVNGMLKFTLRTSPCRGR